MPKTSSFYSNPGYMQHPDDRADTCFWCHGSLVEHYWDYTPPRKDVALKPKVLEAWRKANPGQPLYAVSCCHQCKGIMYHKRMTLLTIFHKRQFWEARNTKFGADDETIDLINTHSMYPWQIKLGDGTIVDKPDEVCDPAELAAKHAYYGIKPVIVEESKPFDPKTDLADFG